MDGETVRGGAVAAVRTVHNPVRLARRVMEATPHLLLAGPGAEAFARAQGLAELANAALITPRTRARWEAGGRESPSGGTVGAVACDQQGRLAAATSTGGTFLKLPGRVGDTPILGAGTWAQKGAAAISCTGHGESILLTGLARWAAEAMGSGRPGPEVCRAAIARLAAAGGNGGLIAIDPSGQPAFWFDTGRMAFAYITSSRALKVGLLPEDRET
jgi:isoaspartyl peptidase/L-asparaginase-like protein (Ntn-hydrolase superfamily)